MKKRSFLLLPLILFGMVLAACHGSNKNETPSGDDSGQVTPGGDDTPSGGDDTPSTVAVSSISLNPTSLTFTVGDPAQTITATVMPVNATDKTVSWSSNHPEFASVANGVVTPVAAGDAVITATAGGKSATCTVTVNPASDPGPGPTPGPGPVTPTTMDLTLTGLPASAVAAHYVVHAWGGEAGEGTQYPAVLEGTTLTVTVPVDITGLLVASFNGDTFDWNSLVFKSSNITIVANQLEYAIPLPTSETMELTITDYPADKHADHYVVHAWGGDSDPADSEATLNESTLTASILVDRTHFLVAAYNGDAFPENWDDLVYQSANIEIVANQTTYSLSGGSTPDPVADPFYYLVGNAAFVGEGKTAWSKDGGVKMDDETADGNLAQEASVAVAAGSELKIYKYVDGGDNDIWLGYSALGASYTFVEEGENELHEKNGNLLFAAAGTYNFFVNSENKIYITDASSTPDPTPAVPAHTLRVFGDSPVNHALTANSDETEYSILALQLAQDDVFKIKMSADDSDWRGYDDFKTVGEGSAHANFEESEGNVKCLVAGYYNFFINVDKNADASNPGKSIWVAVGTAPVDKTGWKAYVNDVETAVADHTGNEIKLLDVELSVGDTIIFKNGTSEQGFEQLKTDEENGDEYFEVGAHNELKALAAGTYDFYVDLGLEKGIWVSKHADPVSNMTLTINNYPAGKTADHYVVHAWGGAAAAQNYEATLVGTTLTVSVPTDITGFLVAAYDGDTFDWDDLIYKSGDFAVVANQTEYEISSKVIVKLYLKADSDITWFIGDNAFIVAEAVVAGDTVYVQATYKATYDSNKTLYFEIEVDALPTTVKLYRCDPAELSTVPSSAPEASAIWNQTNAGAVGGTAENNWVDLNVA